MLRRPSARTRATQFGEVERFGEVVVGAEAEAFDPVVQRVGRGEHEHPAVSAVRGDLPADVVAVDAGQVAVENDHVVAGDRDPLQGFGAVRRDVDGHALAAQPGRDRPGQDLEVLHDQHPHSAPLLVSASGVPTVTVRRSCRGGWVHLGMPEVSARCQSPTPG